MKDATNRGRALCPSHGVSIHASVKDATQQNLFCIVLLCFNPRVREGRDSPQHFPPVHHRVSIHASVKDATSIPCWPLDAECVSIHASVKDATWLDIDPVPVVVLFQSTRP